MDFILYVNYYILLNIYRKRGTFLELVRTGMYDWTREEDRELFRAMLMTVCDLAAITKPWDIEKRVCSVV